jgi:hypothetical protein
LYRVESERASDVVFKQMKFAFKVDHREIVDSCVRYWFVKSFVDAI